MLGLDRIIGVAPRWSDYHGLRNLCDPISSSYHPSAISSAWFVVGFQELRWDCCGIIAMGFYDCDCVAETVLSCCPSIDCPVWICARFVGLRKWNYWRIVIPSQSWNPVAMGARDGRPVALVLYSPAVSRAYCDGIP